MKKISLSILTITLAVSAWAQTLDRSVRPKPGPAPEIKLGKPESFTLPNGMKIFVVENHKLPIVSFSIQLDIKPELEGNMAGFHEMMSELLLSGTKTRTKEKLNEEIDFIGATFNASSNSIYAKGLKKHQTKLLELISDVMMNATFTSDELEKVKSRSISGLEASENEPDAMLENVSAAINFGSKHPFGEVPNKTTIAQISLDRIQKYYSTYFRPNIAYMAIVGDVTLAEIKPLITQYFNAWQKANVPVASYENPSSPKATRVVFVPRDAAVQSVINVTYPIDLKPGTPEVIKAKVLNSILGGGSNGRLFLNLREKHGWTYGSYSSIVQEDLKGHFTAYSKGRNAVTDSSVNEIIAEMIKMRTTLVDQQELQNHINNMTGAFAISLENSQTIAQYAINTERYKMPKDYYKNYLKNLAAVKPEDIQTVAQKFITPEKANIVVVGNKSEVVETLKRFAANGKVEYYDAYGMKIQEETKSASKSEVPMNIKAEDIQKKYVAAIGGEKAIRNIKSIKTVMVGELQGMKLSIEEVKKFPQKMKQVVSGNGMVLQKLVLNGEKGYQEVSGQRLNLEGEDMQEAKQDADIYADLTPEKYGIKYLLKGSDKHNGQDVYEVEETDSKGKKSTKYFNVADGLLVKEVNVVEGPQGASTLVTEYSDYREVAGSDGYKIPYAIKLPLAPGMTIKAVVQSAEVNKNIDDAEFQ